MKDPTIEIDNKEKRQQEETGPGLMYPKDLMSEQIGKAMVFEIYDYIKPSPDALEQQKPKGTIALPIPDELGQGNQLEYTQFDGGFTARLIQQGKMGWDELAKAQNTEGFAASLKSGASSAMSIGQNAIHSMAEAALGDEYRLYESYTGKSLNPKSASVFHNVSFREYQFSYTMIARNKDESIAIRDIIRKFERESHPEAAGVFFKHPALFKFRFLPQELDDWLFKPNICALVSMNVAYNGAATPIFFEQTGAPVEHVLDLQFTEMVLDTKESLDKKYK